MKIGLLSDTHGYLHPSVFRYFESCDEVWHAGDIGTTDVADALSAFKPFRAVVGNIDGADLRKRFPSDLFFDCEGLNVFMTHIGGYPGRYPDRIIRELMNHSFGLFICGHSHILKIIPDTRFKLLHINPGAAGQQGFHLKKTIVRFTIDQCKVKDLDVVELGNRTN